MHSFSAICHTLLHLVPLRLFPLCLSSLTGHFPFRGIESPPSFFTHGETTAALRVEGSDPDFTPAVLFDSVYSQSLQRRFLSEFYCWAGYHLEGLTLWEVSLQLIKKVSLSPITQVLSSLLNSTYWINSQCFLKNKALVLHEKRIAPPAFSTGIQHLWVFEKTWSDWHWNQQQEAAVQSCEDGFASWSVHVLAASLPSCVTSSQLFKYLQCQITLYVKDVLTSFLQEFARIGSIWLVESITFLIIIFIIKKLSKLF